MKFIDTGSDDEFEVKDEQLMSMLNDGNTIIEVLDDDEVHETIDEVTDKFARCYHIKLHDNGEIVYEGYVSTQIIAALENADYIIE
jgi:methyl coenzyme M reductase subunit D